MTVWDDIGIIVWGLALGALVLVPLMFRRRPGRSRPARVVKRK